MKCPDCKNEEFKEENGELYCSKCGLILSEDYRVNDKYETDNCPLNDSVEMNVTLTKLEKKHGYDSKSAQRFRRFKADYFDLFEKILLKEGYHYADIPNIFYNHFIDWYYSRKHKKGGRKRKDIVYDFLIRWEI
jgi:ABC-type ATPase with predicted acetyltransferase domain